MTMVASRVQSRFVQAGGIRMHYYEAGNGDPLICLHGGGPGASAWSNFKQNVDALAENYRVLLVDMPQYGESELVAFEGGRLTFVSRVLAEMMDVLDIPNARFIGNSVGGQTAIKLAIDRPELVQKIVVIGSMPAPSIMSPMPLEGLRLIREYYTGDGPSIEKMRQLIRTLVYDASLVPEETVRERYEASARPEVVELFTHHFPAPEDLSGQLHLNRAPTLIVWGQDDRMGAIDVGLLMLRRFENSQMHIFSKCGHWAQVEHADGFNRLVLDFLNGS